MTSSTDTALFEGRLLAGKRVIVTGGATFFGGGSGSPSSFRNSAVTCL